MQRANLSPTVVDIILSLAWFAAFGILVDAIHKLNCGSIWHWDGFLSGDTCGRWKAAEAFAFISAFVWLVSGIVVRILPDNVVIVFFFFFGETDDEQGIWFTFRKDSSTGRRRWNRSAV